MTIYFEAGNQDLQGKIAVANVIMNRVTSFRYRESSVCAVVKSKSQFSFYWDGKPETVPKNNSNIEKKAWTDSIHIAEAVLSEGSNGWHIKDKTQGALHYATNSTKRLWMEGMSSLIIGSHTFYY
jgi:spore germination cell wall hydrolase CwlJ-like protein